MLPHLSPQELPQQVPFLCLFAQLKWLHWYLARRGSLVKRQLLKIKPLQSRLAKPVISGSFLTCHAWDSGSALVHPFRALGKNSELLVVSDKADMATWQRGSLSLHWASRLSSMTATEANHTRYVWIPQGHLGVTVLTYIALFSKCTNLIGN